MIREYDRRLMHLHIATGRDSGPDVFVNRLEPIGHQLQPPAQRLARQIDFKSLGKNLFLPIQGKMVAAEAPIPLAFLSRFDCNSRIP
jgi:hypothetical protein